METTRISPKKKLKQAKNIQPLGAGQDRVNITGHRKASYAIQSLFGDALAKIKAETKEVIAKEKTRANEAEQLVVKVKAETKENITEIKAETREKEENYEAAIARLKAEAKEKHADYAQQIAQTKAQVQEAIAKIKVEQKEQINKLQAEAQEEQKAHEEQLAKVKTKNEDVVAEIKARHEEQTAKSSTKAKEAIADLKTEWAQQISKIKAKAQDKEKAYDQKTAKTKTESQETIAEIKAEHEQQVAKLKSEAELASGSVSQAIRKMVDSPAVAPSQKSLEVLDLCAEEIMQKDVVWASPDDTVQQTLAAMQRHTTDYIMVGDGSILAGMVSKADLNGALSPYLRPAFEKWRRPLDDATLQIKLKWVMTRPVHIISPEMPLAAVIKNMCQYHLRCLPVVDQQNKVLGLVAEVNIFKTLLKIKSTESTCDLDQSLLETAQTSAPSSSGQSPSHKDNENPVPAISMT